VGGVRVWGRGEGGGAVGRGQGYVGAKCAWLQHFTISSSSLGYLLDR